MQTMDKATFGSPEEFKTLPFIMEKIEVLKQNKQRDSVSVLLREFNYMCKQLCQVKDKNFFIYTKKLIRQDFIKRIESLNGIHEKILLNYVQNYVVTKLKKINIK
jgi:hypothetical protein